MLGAECFNELDVFGLIAGLDKDAKMSLAFIEGLGGLTETTGETVVNESVLQDLLQRTSGILITVNETPIFLTWRASSTESLPLGASVVTSTCSTASTAMSSPASDILQGWVRNVLEGTYESVLFSNLRFNEKRIGMSSSAFVDVRN